MASNSDDSNRGDDDLTARTGRQLEATSVTLRRKFDAFTPNDPELVGSLVRVFFSIVLTVLLVYWGLAYYLDIVWFEF
ncbi:hypothetical protein [Natronorarus salvus]|uniref:hypothetical protein n=1 Tax=Natronorarus salvus TaxID=3117733 RepID=UPI002F264C66